MISASHPGEALAQLGLSHLYPPQPPAMGSEFLTPPIPPRPYGLRYAPRRRDPMPAPAPPAPLPPSSNFPYASLPTYLPHHAQFTSYLYRTRPQPSYPLRPRPSSGFVPPAPAPHSPPAPAPPAPAPPPREEPPISPERNPPEPYFYRGALIRLEDGSLRRVEEMRTEDFVMSADRNSELALTQCNLVGLEEKGDRISLSLTYERNRSQFQVELVSTVDHPFFVYGRGWASCRPERTLARYGLQVQRLQVGDVCVSLVAKKHTAPAPPAAPAPPQTHPENLSVKEDARKRRWSASDLAEDAPPLKKR